MSGCSAQDGFVYATSGAFLGCANLASSYCVARPMMKRSSPSRSQDVYRMHPAHRPPVRPLPPIPQHSRSNSSDWDDDATISHESARTSHDGDRKASCLEALDDRLVSSPMDSFADICWSEAVQDSGSLVRFARYHTGSPDLPPDDDDRTLQTSPVPVVHDGEKANFPSQGLTDDFTWSQGLLPDRGVHCLGLPFPSDQRGGSPRAPPTVINKALAQLEPHFSTQNPSDSVHGFPVARRRPEKISSIRRIARRLAKSST